MSYVSSLSSDVSAYTPVTTSGEISFSGLGNGTDFSEIIDATIEAESFQLDEYKEEKTESEAIIELLETLKDEIEDFNDTVRGMDELDEFYEMSASGADEVSVTASSEAATGSHNIVVGQLAQNDIWVNTEQGYAAEDTEVASSDTTLEFTYAGETISIDVTSGTTLEGLVSLVNSNVDARDKVSASLIYDGSQYYFSLNGEDSGADNVIVVTDTGSMDMDEDDFTNTQTAQNSRIKVDGFPADDDAWIERDTNTVDDVVKGLTLKLTDTTDEDGVQIGISHDTDGMKEKILSFVEEFNQIVLDLQTITGREGASDDDDDDDDDDEDYSINSYALDIVYSELKSTIATGAQGFKRYTEADGGDLYTALSQIGFSTDVENGSDTYGQILVDEEDLDEALNADPEAVAELFAVNGEAESDSDSLQVLSVVDTVTAAGDYDIEYTVSGGTLVSATINGEEASVDGWTILGMDGDSTGLYLSVLDQTDGDHSGSVRVKEGKLGELSSVLSSIYEDDTSTLPILITSYEEDVTSLDNQIYNEEKRLDLLEDSLTRKYAALDSLLSEYENKNSLVASLIAQFN